MKKIYKTFEIEIVSMDLTDILTTSGAEFNDENNNDNFFGVNLWKE